MTTRLCLIGNSHLVALQDALADRPDQWPMDCTFLAFRGEAARDLEISHGILRPGSAPARAQMRERSGIDEVDLTTFDAIAVVGFSLKMQHAQRLWTDARWPGLPSLDETEDIAGMGVTFISRQAAHASLSHQFQNLTGFDLAARIAIAVDCPVYVIGQPRLHARVRHHPMGQAFGVSRAIKCGDAKGIAELFVAASEDVARMSGVRVLHQPERTVVRHILTDPPYMRTPVGGTEGTDQTLDLKHSNAAYGALMLDQLAEAVCP